jgi:hypothetical protein
LSFELDCFVRRFEGRQVAVLKLVGDRRPRAWPIDISAIYLLAKAYVPDELRAEVIMSPAGALSYPVPAERAVAAPSSCASKTRKRKESCVHPLTVGG